MSFLPWPWATHCWVIPVVVMNDVPVIGRRFLDWSITLNAGLIQRRMCASPGMINFLIDRGVASYNTIKWRRICASMQNNRHDYHRARSCTLLWCKTKPSSRKGSEVGSSQSDWDVFRSQLYTKVVLFSLIMVATSHSPRVRQLPPCGRKKGRHIESHSCHERNTADHQNIAEELGGKGAVRYSHILLCIRMQPLI
jgi:hypothetical protein